MLHATPDEVLYCRLKPKQNYCSFEVHVSGHYVHKPETKTNRRLENLATLQKNKLGTLNTEARTWGHVTSKLQLAQNLPVHL